MDALLFTANSFSQYFLSNELRAMEKDGQQSYSISIFATARLNIMATAWKELAPGVYHFPYAAVLIPMGIATQLCKPAGEKYLAAHKNPQTRQEHLLTLLSKAAVAAGTASGAVLQHSDKIVNVACCVSYVALIALGQPVAGTVGLTGMFLIILKANNYLPPIIDEILAPLQYAVTIVSVAASPTHLFFKALDLTLLAMGLASQFSSYESVSKRMPVWVKHPFHDLHKIVGKRDWEGIDKDLSSRCRINQTHIYANELETLIPEIKEDEVQETTEELFKKLHETISLQGIVLDAEQEKGLKKIEKGAYGQVSDILPANAPLFKKIIKALVKSILDDELNQEIAIKDLAAIGNSCTEGWTRDVSFMLNPKTNDIRWMVHNLLAHRRGYLMREPIQKLQKFCMDNNLVVDFDSFGGSNNVHLLNALQVALWNRYRTYDGELNTQLHPRTILAMAFLHYYAPHHKPNKLSTNPSQDTAFSMSFLEYCYQCCVLALTYSTIPILGAGFPFFINEVDKQINETLPEDLVEYIYDAIKPVILTGADRKADAIRKIEWNAVREWIKEASVRSDLDAVVLWEKYVVVDDYNSSYLNKAGVRALLWDMGVLTVN